MQLHLLPLSDAVNAHRVFIVFTKSDEPKSQSAFLDFNAKLYIVESELQEREPATLESILTHTLNEDNEERHFPAPSVRPLQVS